MKLDVSIMSSLFPIKVLKYVILFWKNDDCTLVLFFWLKKYFPNFAFEEGVWHILLYYWKTLTFFPFVNVADYLTNLTLCCIVHILTFCCVYFDILCYIFWHLEFIFWHLLSHWLLAVHIWHLVVHILIFGGAHFQLCDANF